MAKSDTTATIRRGGRYYRDPLTRALVPENDYQPAQPEELQEIETPAPAAPAKKKGN